jgi:hypothetical protein
MTTAKELFPQPGFPFWSYRLTDEERFELRCSQVAEEIRTSQRTADRLLLLRTIHSTECFLMAGLRSAIAAFLRNGGASSTGNRRTKSKKTPPVRGEK